MDRCPRCSTRLEQLSLGAAKTVSCPRCGFADVPVDHGAKRAEPESWRDAINRFYETVGSRE